MEGNLYKNDVYLLPTETAKYWRNCASLHSVQCSPSSRKNPRASDCSWCHRETFRAGFTDKEACRIHDNSFPSFMKRDVDILKRFTQMSCCLRHDLFQGVSESLIMSVTLTPARRCAPVSCLLETSDTLTNWSSQTRCNLQLALAVRRDLEIMFQSAIVSTKLCERHDALGSNLPIVNQ